MSGSAVERAISDLLAASSGTPAERAAGPGWVELGWSDPDGVRVFRPEDGSGPQLPRGE